ncbi:MAG: TolC family protein, partial [Gemmatimonadetes bacterium]|nr:TolC family protein [Gemmatimonadota bacterium]
MNVHGNRALGIGWLLLTGLALPRPGLAQSWSAVDAAREALSNHPVVVQARATTRAARSGIDMARSAYFPNLRLGASLVRFEEPMVVAPLHAFNPMAPPLFDDALVRSQAGLGYTLFDGGVRMGGLSAARAQATGADALGTAAEADVIIAVVEAYVGTAAAAEVVEASQRRRRALEAEVARAEQAFAAGAAPQVEILRAR